MRVYITSDKMKKLPEKPGVYFLYQSSILVYIGKATNLRTRVHTHLSDKVFDEVGYEVVHWSRARKLEDTLLRDHKKFHGQYPHYNKQG